MKKKFKIFIIISIILPSLLIPLFFVLANSLFFDDVTPIQVSFSKVILKWLPKADQNNIGGFKIFRNGTEIATTPVTTREFTDDTVTPGTDYTYQVKPTDGNEVIPNANPPVINVRTMEEFNIDDKGNWITTVVDFINIKEVNSSNSLIDKVKTAFITEIPEVNEADFTSLNPQIIRRFVEEEQQYLNEPEAPLTATERTQLEQELETMKQDYFQGHQLADVFLHEKMIKLGDRHWNEKNSDAAKALYDYSLKFIADVEKFVFPTLFRRAKFEIWELPENADKAQTVAAIDRHAEQILRFFDDEHFPNSTSLLAEQAHVRAAFEYYYKFPDYLSYNDYDHQFFNTCMSHITNAGNIIDQRGEMAKEDDKMYVDRYTRMKAWELGKTLVQFQNLDHAPITGELKITNTSHSHIYPLDPVSDIRSFSHDAAYYFQALAYKGHTYSFSVKMQEYPGIVTSMLVPDIKLIPEKKLIYKNGVLEAAYDIDYQAENIDPSVTSLIIIRVNDADNDGISDYAEEKIYGTNKDLADTDGDGLNDFFEIFVTKTNAKLADSDGNGINDALEDIDNDGITNIQEMLAGMDPLDKAIQGKGYKYEITIQEDAEDKDIANWQTLPDGPQGTISNVIDPYDDSNRVIKLDGDGLSSGYAYTFPKIETIQHKIQWSMKFDEPYEIIVKCHTVNGKKYLRYTADETSQYGTGQVVQIGLGPDKYTSPDWVTVRRDLDRDLELSQDPDDKCKYKILYVEAFLVRGSGYVDDVHTYAYHDQDRDLLPTAIELAAGTNPNDVSDKYGDVDTDTISNYTEFMNGTEVGIADSDGDGFHDGQEKSYGLNPNNPAVDGFGFKYEITYHDDMEDRLKHWTVSDNEPAGATLEKVVDPVKASNSAVKLTGQALDNGYTYTFTPAERMQEIIQWRHHYNELFNVKITCVTDAGDVELLYSPVAENQEMPEGTIHHGLGTTAIANKWKLIRRDLTRDLWDKYPARTLICIKNIEFRGSGYIDDIVTLAYQDADHDLIPDSIETAWGLDANDHMDAYGDLDNDGITNLDEFIYGQNIGNRAPIIKLTVSPAFGPAPLIVNFDASESTDPDGKINSYVWNFGDETTGSGSTVQHEYTVEGAYTASLTVTDDSGASIKRNIRINCGVTNDQPPTSPTNLRLAAKGQTIITLKWEPAADETGIAGYDVFRDGILQRRVKRCCFADSNLLPGFTYEYSIKAFDSQGQRSESSNTVSVALNHKNMPIYYVDYVNGNDENHGFTPANSRKNLQSTISQAVPGSVIVLAKGRHVVNNIDLKKKNLVIIGQHGPQHTELDCEHQFENRAFSFTNPLIDHSTIIEGISVTAGNVTGNGGGVLINSSSPVIGNCIIKQSHAGNGAGIAITGETASPVIVNTVVKDNEALSNGGGIYFDQNAKPKIRACDIKNNKSKGKGAGIYAAE